jgi:hypothetical protein
MAIALAASFLVALLHPGGRGGEEQPATAEPAAATAEG